MLCLVRGDARPALGFVEPGRADKHAPGCRGNADWVVHERHKCHRLHEEQQRRAPSPLGAVRLRRVHSRRRLRVRPRRVQRQRRSCQRACRDLRRGTWCRAPSAVAVAVPRRSVTPASGGTLPPAAVEVPAYTDVCACSATSFSNTLQTVLHQRRAYMRVGGLHSCRAVELQVAGMRRWRATTKLSEAPSRIVCTWSHTPARRTTALPRRCTPAQPRGAQRCKAQRCKAQCWRIAVDGRNAQRGRSSGRRAGADAA